MANYAKRVNKFKNIKCQADGINFDSKAEMRRYTELKLLERAGEIKNLKLQPRYPLMCGEVPVRIRNKNGTPRRTFYLADFEYEDMSVICGESVGLVVEDVKGMDTPVSRLKRALIEAHYNIEVRIIRYR